MSNRSIHTLLKNWDEECPLTREEAVEVLNLPEEEMDSLMECAYALRTKYKGKKVSVQLLTNVRSGNCTQNCATVHSPRILRQRLRSIREYQMKSFMVIMIW